jgi:hypothetical protein
VKLVKLWTWQKKGFSLIDSVKPIDSQTHSDYYSEHKEEFEELWNRLGTTQFIWCYTEKEDVFSQASKLEYKDHTLWELDVPVESIFKNTCSIAWSWILKGCRCQPPSKLRDTWRRKYPNNSRQMEEDWHCFWKKKTIEELWDALFLSNIIITPCSTLLVRYPLEQQWIKREVMV